MKSFFLTSEFKSSKPGNTEVLDGGKSYEVVVGDIKKEVNTFEEVTRLVIGKLEGGYYNAQIHNTRDSRYKGSGETMFGIDRKTGGTINTSAAGVSFWKKIDAARGNKSWAWNYIPPDPLQKELVDLVIKMMRPLYDSLMKTYIEDKNLQSVIESDGRLFFNFVYAVWNGTGWFKRWARQIKRAYNGGTKNSEDLLKLFVSLRANSSNSLIAQGGVKIETLVGLKRK